MNERVRIILWILAVIIVVWGIIFLIDYGKCADMKMPIFVIEKEMSEDGSKGTYYGLGYTVKVEKNEENITRVEMYIFDRFIAGAIAETNNISLNENERAGNISSEEKIQFRAIVKVSKTEMIEVEPIEEKDKKVLSDRVIISLGENNDMLYSEGGELLITYTGLVRETYPSQIDVIKIETEMEYKGKIEELPKDYSLEKAVEDNCVVSTNDYKIYNKDELDRFLENVENNRPDFIRCIDFTKEGDMIITDVNFEGSNSFRVCIDSTRDKFSSEEDRIYHYGRFTKININDDIPDWRTIILENPIEGELKEVYITGYGKKITIINK